MDLLDTNFHAQVWEMEKLWDDPKHDKFFEDVERLSGVVNLDGDQVEDGYSLDWLNDLYSEGVTAEKAAELIKRNRGVI